jgi:hypothetical protein
MKKIILSISIFLIAFTTSFAQVAENAADVTPLKVGEKAPSVELTSIENTSTSLQEIVKRKPTVLLFYRGGWCPLQQTFSSSRRIKRGDISTWLSNYWHKFQMLQKN